MYSINVRETIFRLDEQLEMNGGQRKITKYHVTMDVFSRVYGG